MPGGRAFVLVIVLRWWVGFIEHLKYWGFYCTLTIPIQGIIESNLFILAVRSVFQWALKLSKITIKFVVRYVADQEFMVSYKTMEKRYSSCCFLLLSTHQASIHITNSLPARSLLTWLRLSLKFTAHLVWKNFDNYRKQKSYSSLLQSLYELDTAFALNLTKLTCSMFFQYT
jgi:hypothetical protein